MANDIEVEFDLSPEEDNIDAQFDIDEEETFDCQFTIDAVTFDYEQLDKKPTLNSVTIVGDKISSDYGLASTDDITTLQTNIQNETTSRQNSDTLLQNNINTLETNLNAEISNRTNADSILSNEISNEASNREDADESLQEQITTNHNNFANYRTSANQDIIDASKQDKLTAGSNIQINNNVISATDTTYTAGNGLTLTGTQFSANVVDNVISTSNTNSLSANMGKQLQDQIDNLKARGRYLSQWNSTTGLAETQPTTLPYDYKAGDYFIVGTVGEINYKPTGSQYTGVASTTVETNEIAIEDVYYYDGNVWHLQQNTQKTVSFANLSGQPTDNTNLANALNSKQDTLISGTNIKTVNNESLLGSGNVEIDMSTLINVTYAELVELKTNVQLKEGAFYRITDYVTTTNGNSADSSELSRSAGHQFDIIIQAIGTSNLCDIGTCALHEGDTYFASQNLGAWQVWYDINNDTTKYAWAVTDGTGKGVIYRMIDEHQNDLPYDFKNIQFYRDKTLDKYSIITSYLTAEDDYYYTFTYSSTLEDESILLTDNKATNNVIGVYNNNLTNNVLNNNVIISSNNINFNILEKDDYNNTIAGRNFYTNTFKDDVYNNIFTGTSLYSNNIGSWCYNNVINGKFYSNNIGNSFKNNKITVNQMFSNNIYDYFDSNTISGYSISSNTFKSEFHDNTITVANNKYIQCNIFGNNFYSNTITTTNNIQHNIINSQFNNNTIAVSWFGGNIIGEFFNNNIINSNNTFYENNIKNNMQNNTINGSFKSNNIGDYYQNNTHNGNFHNNVYIGVSVQNNTFGETVRDLIIEDFVQNCEFPSYFYYSTIKSSTYYVKFPTSSTASSSNRTRYLTIKNISGTSATNKLDLSGLPTHQTYPITIELDDTGKVLATWQDGNITVGKQKASITATEWTDLVPTMTLDEWEA